MNFAMAEMKVAVAMILKRYVLRSCSSQILKRTAKRYQDPVLWVWFEIVFTPKRYRPFPRSLAPLFQNESKCETFHMKMSSACGFIFMQIKVIFTRMVRTQTRFEREAQGNQQMAYCLLAFCLKFYKLNYFFCAGLCWIKINHFYVITLLMM